MHGEAIKLPVDNFCIWPRALAALPVGAAATPPLRRRPAI
jgi:hypothetical protein